MPTAMVTNRAKKLMAQGKINMKAFFSGTVTFTNTGDKLERASGSWVTDGFEVGDKVYTTSTANDNEGPFLVKAFSDTDKDMEVTSLAQAAVTLSDTAVACEVGTFLFACYLMRAGFIFNVDDHSLLQNIVASTETVDTTTNNLVFTTNTITRTTGTWPSAWLVGNKVTIAGLSDLAANDGDYLISDISGAALTLTDLNGADPAMSTGTENSAAAATFNTDDRYDITQFSTARQPAGAASITEDDTNNRMDATFGNIVFPTTLTGVVTQSPGMIIVNEASATPEIVGYIAFNSPQDIAANDNLTVSGVTVRIS